MFADGMNNRTIHRKMIKIVCSFMFISVKIIEPNAVFTFEFWGLFSIYGWARSQPMREDVTYVTSSLIG